LQAGELRITMLEDDVGERTAESGTRSLFQLAAATEGGIDLIDSLCTSLSIEVVELRAAVETAVGNTYKMVLDKLGEQLQTALAPLFGFFGVLSSNKSTPGDLLNAKMKQLQAQISGLKQATSRSQGSLRTIPML
jgi:hypothetical protein